MPQHVAQKVVKEKEVVVLRAEDVFRDEDEMPELEKGNSDFLKSMD